jgi:uncharacterized protein with FMN-binding domain
LDANPVQEVQTLALLNLSQFEDGIYRGAYTHSDYQFTVDITIKAHLITEITVINGPKRVFTQKCGLCDAMDMIRDVIATQSLPVDAYSGATPTTAAILRAVEEALTPQLDEQDDPSSHHEAWK